MLSLILCLFLDSLLAMLFCLIINILAGFLVWQKVLVIHPNHGVIILEPKLFRFEGEGLKIQGEISKKSRFYGNNIWLHIKGFSNNHWLIISANGVNEQSYARLKRATLSAVNCVLESK
ncbi:MULTISPECIES: hypothetical protein [unclassified Pseudoalteromonas]|uniref:hypothetical protein n=1 Tax=unclassified Pseudoalteromonas TaxID=194690 RepID=UPI001F1110B8|nr:MULTISPECIES: hypothetical protein [unclassified Pseudoalteromonas]